MNKYTNSQVLDFLKMVENKKGYIPNASEVSLLKDYDECDNFAIKRQFVDSIWKFFKSHFSSLNRITKVVTPITIMHTNAGVGRVIEGCPVDNVSVTAYHNDYTCKKICDLINDRLSFEFAYKSEVSDISHFFINGDNGNTPKHDIVFTKPDGTAYYRSVDGTNLSNLSPDLYYSVRSLDFLTKGGYLCIVAHPRKFDVFRRGLELKERAEEVASIDNNGALDQYGCLIFKKK